MAYPELRLFYVNFQKYKLIVELNLGKEIFLYRLIMRLKK